jgi:hypothetical protein
MPGRPRRSHLRRGGAARITTPKIDTEDFEITAYLGQISVEDFGSNFIYGARVGYHVSEGLFLEGTYAMSGDVDRSSVEVLDNIDLLGDDRDFSYYDLAVGWNLLPGEVFLGRNRASTGAYVTAAPATRLPARSVHAELRRGAGDRSHCASTCATHVRQRRRRGQDHPQHRVQPGRFLVF